MRIPNLLAAALALALVPGRAAAQSDTESCPPSSQVGKGQGGTGVGVEQDTGVQQAPPVDEGTGGAGVSGEAEGQIQQDEDAMGGTGTLQTQPPSAQAEQETTVVITTPEETQKKEKAKTEGLGFNLLGGVEGYTGALAPLIDPGGNWGVVVTAQPLPAFGVELGYSGAVNNIDDPVASDGQIIRNGGNVNLKFSLSPTTVEPFVFGGVGISRANVRRTDDASGYQDDTFGQVPVGAGINFHIADNLNLGVRASYGFLFDRDYTPATGTNSFGLNNKQSGDLWNGQAQFGAQF